MRFHRPALSITVSIPIFRTTLLCLLAGILSARAVEPAFIYQGHLQESGGPTTGAYDLRFELYDSLEAGTLVAGPLTNTAASVSNGLFTTSLDFGVETFDGAERWLAIAVRTNGVGAPFEPLWPRQRVSPAPYALRAMRVQASGVDGTLGVSQLPVAALTNGAAGVTLSGAFIGSGAGLSGVNAAAVGGTGLPGLWQLGGNSVGANQFLGSTNEHPLDLRTGGRRVLRLESEPDWGTVRITGGSAANSAGGYGATVSGGGATNYLFTPRAWANIGSGDFSAIAGGAGNQVSGNWGSIGGGRENVAAGDYSSVGGGNANSASASFGVVGGGASNTNLASYGTISGGALNSVTGLEAAVGGGINNIASARNATVSGGSGNIASGPGAIVGGGGYNGSVWRGNVASGAVATISGGLENKATAEGAFVGGGSYNRSGVSAGAVLITSRN